MNRIAATFFTFLSISLFAQDDAATLKNIYKQSLTNGQSYAWLDHLSNKIGGRLSGSENAQKAVEYTKAELEKLRLDKVWLQEVMVPKWVRGEKEVGYFMVNGKKYEVNICALGGSTATSDKGLQAKVVEVKSFEQTFAGLSSSNELYVWGKGAE